MKLKHLKLQGYKTFAAKTEFVFDEDITAIVGPNGSGKSNVADAVRWVLGEQSYSTLRGKRTVDMIFSGSNSRPRAGMAQAVLTLDNEDGWLPIDYTEVEICRRAYRSGENEYLLNGQKVRLMDIQDLLARAGLAEQTYTIIGQGLIDQALSLKSDERRALFEEAAGISHYKSKRASTLRKLQNTQRNLQRVHDILAELKPRVRSLRRQAKRAEDYEQVNIDLRHLLRIWYGFQWDKQKTDLRKRRADAETAEKNWQDARQKWLDKQEKIDERQGRLHTYEEQLQQKRTARDEVREKLEQARREIAILTERRAALERQLEESGAELPALEEQLTTAEAELKTAVNELHHTRTELKEQQAELETFETGYREKKAEIDKWQRTVRQHERTQREAQNKLAQAQGQLSQLQERLQEQQTADAEDDELVTLEKRAETILAAVSGAQEKAAELRHKRSAEQQKRHELDRQINEVRQTLKGVRKQHNHAQNELARLQTRTDMLNQMRRADLPATAEAADFTPLAQYLTIPADYRRAIELSLQARLGALVVPHDRAETMWRIVQQRQADQSLALLPPDPQPPADEEAPDNAGVIGWAHTTVDCPDEVRAAVDALLNRVLLVQDADAARAVADRLPTGCTAVSLDGVLVHATGLIELPRTDGQDSMLAREEAYRTAVQKQQAQEEALSTLIEQIAVQESAVKKLNTQLDDVYRERKRFGRLENEAAQRADRAQRDLDKLEQQQQFIRRRRAEQQREQDRLKERITKTEQQIETHHADLKTITQDVEQAREKLAALPTGQQEEQQRKVLRQQINATRSIMDSRRAIVDSRRATLNQIEKQIRRLKERRQSWSSQLLKMNLDALEGGRDTQQKQMDALTAEIEPLVAGQKKTQTELRKLQMDASVDQKAAHELENQYTKTKVALTQQENKVDNLRERIKSEIGLVSLRYDEDEFGDTPLPLGEVIEELPEVEELPEGLDESIQKRRGQLRRMGAINPDAPAEYEEVRERHDFLEQQVEDLNTTEDHLRQAIAELDILTSRAFADTVEKVNAVFGEMFTRLFGGGSAELELTDPDDLTITGVDIVAQLPGRRPQGLALLSGGERSLTAASLIFALLKVSPTPFCVMDEVDAALDEANVNRFRDVLMELSKQTQFIVITHNRGTVQAAHAIYGITMDTDGTSEILSVKPEEYVTQAELLH